MTEASDTKPFPMNARVVLAGLKAEEFNGKGGIVKSELKDGRHQVLVGKKFLGLKPSNLKYEIRPIESLAVDELKNILKENKVNLSGMDVADLRREVGALDSVTAFELLAKANVRVALEKAKEAELRAQQERAKPKPSSSQAAADKMNPEQLRKQAKMMRSMPPHQIRRMAPHLRGMTDAQLQDAIDQMEQMADNPEMFELAKQQMKDMSPEDLAKMQAGARTGAAAPQGTMDAEKMLENMDGKQLKNMVEMMKKKPELLKTMMPNADQEQMKKMLSMFDGMDDQQLESAVSMMKGAQKVSAPIRKVYSTVNGWCGGHLIKIVVLFVFSYFLLFVYLRFFVAGNIEPPATMEDIKESAVPVIEKIKEDLEF